MLGLGLHSPESRIPNATDFKTSKHGIRIILAKHTNYLLSIRLRRTVKKTHRTQNLVRIPNKAGGEGNYRRIPFCTSSHSISSLLLILWSGCLFDGPLEEGVLSEISVIYSIQLRIETLAVQLGTTLHPSIHYHCLSLSLFLHKLCQVCSRALEWPPAHNDIDNNSRIYLPQSLPLLPSIYLFISNQWIDRDFPLYIPIHSTWTSQRRSMNTQMRTQILCEFPSRD